MVTRMNVYRCVHTRLDTHKYFLPLLCLLRGPGSVVPQGTPWATSWFLTPLPKKQRQGPLEKWPTLGPRQETHRTSPEHLVAQRVRKCWLTHTRATLMGRNKKAQDPPKRAPSSQGWDSLSQNAKCKTNF